MAGTRLGGFPLSLLMYPSVALLSDMGDFPRRLCTCCSRKPRLSLHVCVVAPPLLLVHSLAGPSSHLRSHFQAVLHQLTPFSVVLVVLSLLVVLQIAEVLQLSPAAALSSSLFPLVVAVADLLPLWGPLDVDDTLLPSRPLAALVAESVVLSVAEYRGAVNLWEREGSDSVVGVLPPWGIEGEGSRGKLFCWGNIGGLTRV